ncbi:MAG: hypothetical protein EON85_00225 [Brevundimonas sp.]|nr:MAG: hypothetical protein EON85_00225 [Brevundimonas sp.]
MLMLHHPTSLHGPDDGLLLGDWSNTGVHGGMILCLMVIGVGVSTVPRWLGETHLTVRAGGMAFTGGMAALITAALVNGFAIERLAGPAAALQLPVLAALNQTLAGFGMLMVAAALGLWAVRLLGLSLLAKGAGVVGLVAVLAAAGWLLHGDGFGLVPATVATGVFAAWSVLTAACLMRGPVGEAE